MLEYVLYHGTCMVKQFDHTEPMPSCAVDQHSAPAVLTKGARDAAHHRRAADLPHTTNTVRCASSKRMQHTATAPVSTHT